MASTPDLIRTAVERFQAEVPALAKLKLVFGLELRAKHDIQLYRVELPGPKISKELAQDERVLIEIDRPQFNQLAEKGTISSYRKAARLKDAGERSDLEAGMAKLLASETGKENVEDAFRIHGGYGYSKEYEIERLYRDAPLLLIGEGTSEIQRMVIGKKVLQRNKI